MGRFNVMGGLRYSDKMRSLATVVITLSPKI